MLQNAQNNVNFTWSAVFFNPNIKQNSYVIPLLLYWTAVLEYSENRKGIVWNEAQS
jgi:hypothetical protein